MFNFNKPKLEDLLVRQELLKERVEYFNAWANTNKTMLGFILCSEHKAYLGQLKSIDTKDLSQGQGKVALVEDFQFKLENSKGLLADARKKLKEVSEQIKKIS